MPAPSHIFIIRHGTRLDQSLADWIHTSPTPYDTPLTYAGFTGARSIGRRITELLSQHPSSSPKPPRFIIHTSPFLRCLQTAISLSTTLPSKPTLRITSFLTEWMTPEYYTHTIPPPPTPAMVSSALSDLLRPPDAPPNTPPDPGAGPYTPPVPSHAVDPNAAIPRGFYEHARPRVTIDWCWDAHAFGRGAELGEEWHAMHRRFREGFRGLLSHYAGQPADEHDTVLVLVTHGAGCNALLGALSGLPVLVDIGTASISMGVRAAEERGGEPPRYEVPVAACTTHLRAAPAGQGAGFALVGGAQVGRPRACSQGGAERPTGLWTRPVVAPVIAGAVAPFEEEEEEGAPELLPPPVLEHSGTGLGEEGRKGLWAAKAWGEGGRKEAVRRRWTVGREAWGVS